MTDILPPSNDDPQRGCLYIPNALAMLLIGVGPAMPLESKLKSPQPSSVYSAPIGKVRKCSVNQHDDRCWLCCAYRYLGLVLDVTDLPLAGRLGIIHCLGISVG